MPVAFEHVLLPYDDSQPARTALDYAIGFAHRGAKLTIEQIVDETSAFSIASPEVFADSTIFVDALNDRGRAILDTARERCAAAGVEAITELMHEQPVPGIIKAAHESQADLIIMGTHAREGIARAVLGSITEGVLRSCIVPVLIIRSSMQTGDADRPFHNALIAVDDSEPADAAITIALQLAQTVSTRLLLCNVIDTREPFEKAGRFGYDSLPVVAELHRQSHLLEATVARIQRDGCYADMAVFEGEPATALLTAAHAHRADLIVVGSHGRRGVRRFMFGGVAESIARRSDVPVLVVRVSDRERTR